MSKSTTSFITWFRLAIPAKAGISLLTKKKCHSSESWNLPTLNIMTLLELVICDNSKYIRPLQLRKTGIYDFSINIRPLWGRSSKA